MNHKQKHIVGGGLGTFRKQAIAKREAEVLREQTNLTRLSKSRTPQMELAMKFVLYGEGYTLNYWTMDDGPQKTVFEDAMFAFKTVQKTGSKSTIELALEEARSKNAHFFKDEATKAAAEEAIVWARSALSWAGKRLYAAKPTKPKKAPATA